MVKEAVQGWLTDTILRDLFSKTGLLDYSASSMSVYLEAVSCLTIPDELQRGGNSIPVLQALSQEVAQEWFQEQSAVELG